MVPKTKTLSIRPQDLLTKAERQRAVPRANSSTRSGTSAKAAPHVEKAGGGCPPTGKRLVIRGLDQGTRHTAHTCTRSCGANAWRHPGARARPRPCCFFTVGAWPCTSQWWPTAELQSWRQSAVRMSAASPLATGERQSTVRAMILAGLEPAIFGSEDQRLIH